MLAAKTLTAARSSAAGTTRAAMPHSTASWAVRRRPDRTSSQARITNKPREPLRTAAARDQAPGDFRKADLSAVRYQPHVTGEGHLQSAAQRVPVNRGHSGLREVGEQLDVPATLHPVTPGNRFLRLTGFLEIHARTEIPVSGSGEHHDADLAVSRDRAPERGKLVPHDLVTCVRGLGPG
jgi:hypothetical protein